MTQISIRLPDDDVAAIDELVEAGEYATRSAFLAAATAVALAAARERQVAEQYRRAYGEQVEDEDESWIFDVRDRFLRESE